MTPLSISMASAAEVDLTCGKIRGGLTRKIPTDGSNGIAIFTSVAGRVMMTVKFLAEKESSEKKGRWRNNLIGKIARGGKSFDDYNVSPVIRQALQHWGYVLTEKDAKAYVQLKGLPPLRRALGTKPNARHYPLKRQGRFDPNTMDRI